MLAGAAFGVLAACAGEEPAAKAEKSARLFPLLPREQVPLLDAGPKVDGKVDDAEWSKAAKLAPFRPNMGGPNKAGPRTEVFAATTSKSLFLAFRCHEKDLEGLIGKAEAFDWNDDGLEIFLRAGDDPQEPYHHFQVNAAGALHMEYNRAEVRDVAGIERAAGREAGAWTVELEIPFAKLTLPEEKAIRVGPWRFNVVRTRPMHEGDRKPGGAVKVSPKEGPYNEETAWSPTECGSGHMPHMFGYWFLESFGGRKP